MLKKMVYYAHSMALYGTPQEERDIVTLSCLGFDVLNPGDPCYKGRIGSGMEFFKIQINECDILAFRSHVDMLIGAGVAQEIAWAEELGIPIIELPSRIKHRTMDLETTREYLREVGQR